MCNSDVNLQCARGDSSTCPALSVASDEAGGAGSDRDTAVVRTKGLRRQNGRMIRAQPKGEDKRVCRRGKKRKVTWYQRLLGYRLVRAFQSTAELFVKVLQREIVGDAER